MKKTISILLVITMTMSLAFGLSACGNKNGNGTDSNTGSSDSSDNGEADTTEETNDQSPTKNSDGTYTYHNLFGTGEEATGTINVDDYISREDGMYVVDFVGMVTDAGWAVSDDFSETSAPKARIYPDGFDGYGEILFGASISDAGTVDGIECYYFKTGMARHANNSSPKTGSYFFGISKYTLNGLVYHLKYNHHYVMSYDQLVFTALILSNLMQSDEYDDLFEGVDLSSLEIDASGDHVIP